MWYFLNLEYIQLYVKLLSSHTSSWIFRKTFSVSRNSIICRMHKLCKTKTLSQCWWQMSTWVNNPNFFESTSLSCVWVFFLLFSFSAVGFSEDNYILYFFLSFLTPFAMPWDIYKSLQSLWQKYILLVNWYSTSSNYNTTWILKLSLIFAQKFWVWLWLLL